MEKTARSDETDSKKKLLYCNHCKTETNHINHSEYLRKRIYGEEWEEIWYRLWICAGCEDATLEISYQNSGYGGPEYWDVTYCPRRTEYNVPGKSFIELPEKLDKIYRETIQAFNNNLNVLCATGLRALIEGICDDKGMKGGNLEKKIEDLKNILPANIVSNIHSFRFIGNAAIHELTPPTNDVLKLAIEIVEDLLNFIYELDYKASRLNRKRQPDSV